MKNKFEYFYFEYMQKEETRREKCLNKNILKIKKEVLKLKKHYIEMREKELDIKKEAAINKIKREKV